MKRATAAGVIAATILVLAPGSVWANPSTASGSCQAGVSYEGHDYPQTNGNTATISIDDVVVRTVTFSTSTSGNVANPDKTKPHTWQVVWDRVNGTNGDRTQHGDFAACQTPATTTTLPTTTLPTTTTTVPATTTTLPAPTTTPATTTTVAATVPTPPTTVATFICTGVMVADVCAVPTTTIAPPSRSIPATGNKTDIELAIGLSALCIGWCLLRIRRSRA